MAQVDIFTYKGEEWGAARMVGTVATDGHFFGWGSGEGTAAKSDTTLFEEETESRVTGTVSLVGDDATAKYQSVGTLTADADKTITNAANFTASTSGTMIVHSSFDGVDLNEGDQMTFTVTIDPS